MEPANQSLLSKPVNTFGTMKETSPVYDAIPNCKALGMRAIPGIGIYANEY